MMVKFEISDFCHLYYYLVLEVKQIADGIFSLQEQYAKTLLKRFGMLRYIPTIILLNTSDKIGQDGEKITNPNAYKSLIGGLIYLTHTRPDIALGVSIISRFMEKPSKYPIFSIAKRIIRYTAGIVNFKI